MHLVEIFSVECNYLLTQLLISIWRHWFDIDWKVYMDAGFHINAISPMPSSFYPHCWLTPLFPVRKNTERPCSVWRYRVFTRSCPSSLQNGNADEIKPLFSVKDCNSVTLPVRCFCINLISLTFVMTSLRTHY